jgi:tetratricopeptide (TPR) repeat protein
MPLNPTLQSVMGLLLSQRGRPAAGEFHFRRVIELDGEKPVVANNLAYCLKLQGKVEESEEWYRRAVQLAPDDPAVRVGWSKLEEARRNLPRAWELLREAENLGGDKGTLALERAVLLGREGRMTEAIAELDRSRAGGSLPTHFSSAAACTTKWTGTRRRGRIFPKRTGSCARYRSDATAKRRPRRSPANACASSGARA